MTSELSILFQCKIGYTDGAYVTKHVYTYEINIMKIFNPVKETYLRAIGFESLGDREVDGQIKY